MKEVNPQFANKPTVKIMGRTFVGTTASLAAFASQAAIDVSAVTTELETKGVDSIEMVGMAMLGLAVVAVVFKWVKAAFF